MRFFTESRLGPKREKTPEGFLVCYDVPIARTGEMIYAAGETPIEPGRDGLVRIQRDASEVFHPDSIASFLGKPVTLDHPPVMVSPANFRMYAAGSAQNVRRGEGEQADLLLADLVIADAAAIKAVLDDGIDEVSNGYDADYEQDAPGLGRQVGIRGNHVAIVREGRCGSRCAIGDTVSGRFPAAASTMPAKARFLASASRGARDRNFEEAEHPRALNGRFGRGISSSHHEHDREVEAHRIEPVNSVDPDKVEQIAEAMRRDGWSGRPVLTFEGAYGTTAATGSHRIAAAHEAGIDVPVLEIGEDAANFMDEDGNTLDQVIGTGDDAVLVKFLREAGDDRAADLAQAEIDANETDHTFDRRGLARRRNPRVQIKTRDAAPRPLAPLRCGCDAHPTRFEPTRITPMPKRTAFDRLRRALFAKDEKAIEQAMDEVQSEVEEAQASSEQSEAEQKLAGMIQAVVTSALEPVVAALGDRMDGMDGRMKAFDDDMAERKRVADEAAEAERVKAEVPAEPTTASDEVPDDDKGESMTADAAGLAAEFQDTKARAEILSPGIKLPVYDGKATKKTVADSLCALRREALKAVLGDASRKPLAVPFVTDAAAIPAMSCEAARMAFVGASELAKAANRVPTTRTVDAALRESVRTSVTTMQAAADALWSTKR